MQHESDAARELRDLDTFLDAASRKSGRPRGEVAETLLRAITAELLPAMDRIARIANAMVASDASDASPQRFEPVRSVPRFSDEMLNVVPMVAQPRNVAPEAEAAIVAHLKTEPEARSQRAIAKATGLSASTVSRGLHRLRVKGVIERQRDRHMNVIRLKPGLHL